MRIDCRDRAAQEIVTHYTETYDESQRLTDGRAVILDVGGATGA